MKYFALIVIILAGCGFKKIKSRPEEASNSPQTMSTLYNLTVNTIDGTPVKLEEYKGKKLLIVNTASECGFTPQYEDLQELHKKYGDKVTILGFPANNFGGQEPGTNAEIASFCQTNYGVTFQMFEKVSVKGKDMHPLYSWLSNKDQNGWNDQEPSWNFCKYLINEKGELLKFYASAVNPMSDEIISEIL